MADCTKIRSADKKLEAINQVIHSLGTKLEEKRKKKGKAYQTIFKLNKLYDEKV